MIFLLLPNNTHQQRFRVQQRTIKVAANNNWHCTLAIRSLPLQQHQAPERACMTFSQISNHLYNQLIKMLDFFPLVSCTTILTCGRYKVIITCSVIFKFFLQQQQQKHYISASKSWQLSNAQAMCKKFCVVFFVQRKVCVAFPCKNKILRDFVWYNVCNNFFSEFSSCNENICEGFTYWNEIVLYVLVKSKPNWVI